MLAKDQISEITIIGDENPVLSHGNGQDFLIREPRRMIASNSGCVVSLTVEKDADSGLSTLVEQKSHRGAGAAPARVSSRVEWPASCTSLVAKRKHARIWSTVSSG